MSRFAVMPLTDYVNSCDKLREKTDTIDDIKSGEFPNKIEEVYEAGEQYVLDIANAELTGNEFPPAKNVDGLGEAIDYALWQQFAKGQANAPNVLEYATSLSNLYFGARFPTNSKISLITPNVNRNINYVFYNALRLTEITLRGISDWRTLDCQNTFREATNLVTIDLTDYKIKPSNAFQMFYWCSALKEIKGELDFSESTNVGGAFSYCSALVEVRIKANTLALSISFVHSPDLSANSRQSIIDGLADLTGGTSQTISWHSSVLEKLTIDQYSQMTNKNWSWI